MFIYRWGLKALHHLLKLIIMELVATKIKAYKGGVEMFIVARRNILLDAYVEYHIKEKYNDESYIKYKESLVLKEIKKLDLNPNTHEFHLTIQSKMNGVNFNMTNKELCKKFPKAIKYFK